MIVTKNLLPLLLIIFSLVTSSLLQTSSSPANNSCIPSSCGLIHNITFPFRLIHNPKNCGLVEISCENDIPSMDINSHKYNIKAIEYENPTIRLADASINNNTCSFPNSSLNFDILTTYDIQNPFKLGYNYSKISPLNFMTCQYPLKNSSFSTEITHCSSNSTTRRHSYVRIGRMKVLDVEYMCRIDAMVITSWRFRDFNKTISISEIHHSLLYGFELPWVLEPDFNDCKGALDCLFRRSYSNIRSAVRLRGLGVFLVLAVFFVTGALLVGISLPAMIIFGPITVLCGFFIYGEIYELIDTYTYDGRFRWLPLLIGILFAFRFIIFFFCIMGFLIYMFQRRHLSMFHVIESFLQSENNKLMPIRYSYSDIKKMTRGFGEKLGEGGFGSVYKGKLRSGYDVAVKLLGNHKSDGKDFVNEIMTIGRIHHVNVVTLVGYCAERSKRALVLDFMPNGSLEKMIGSLNWERKFEIAVGVARGIEYLHRGCDIQILHFDIKPHNILLDENFIPKVSDFGLAKLCSTQTNTVTLTAARGTIGYVAPELINRGFGGVSNKADVYSFGMLLMEMVGLNRDSMMNNDSSSKYFPCWIYDCFDKGKDIVIEEDDSVKKISTKMTIVALWCIQMSPSDRPSMNKVLEMLEGDVERLQIPHRPSQSHQVVVNEVESWTSCSTDSVPLLCHEGVEMTVQVT